MTIDTSSEEPLTKKLKSTHHSASSPSDLAARVAEAEHSPPHASEIEHDELDGDEDDQDQDDTDGKSYASSMVEDILDVAEDNPYQGEDDDEDTPFFSIEEANKIRSHLRRIGAQDFVEQYLNNGRYTLRHLATAFGVPPNLPLPDSAYVKILMSCIYKEINKRQRLTEYNTIDDAVQLLQKSKNILVITGAGISTSLGIPDFRSKNTGFYARLQEQGFHEPEQVFDLHEFDADPSIFYKLAREILPVTDRCSTTHAFIRLLQDKGKLLTNYTQNIDNIEAIAGISSDKLIQCHGSWATASCRKCGNKVPGTEIFADVEAQRVSRCKVCVKASGMEVKRKRAKSTKSAYSDDESDGEYDIFEPGVMKPGITFFYEQLPNTFFDRLTEHDRDLVDLVIVIGTSMKVSPVNQIPNYVPADVPQIYISRDAVSHVNFDVQLLGYCDDVVSELSRRAGWMIDHEGFDKSAKAEVARYDDEAAHYWNVEIPGKKHTAEEKAEAEKLVEIAQGHTLEDGRMGSSED